MQGWSCVVCGRTFVRRVEHCDDAECGGYGEPGTVAVHLVHGDEPGAAYRVAVMAEWGLLLGRRTCGRAGNN